MVVYPLEREQLVFQTKIEPPIIYLSTLREAKWSQSIVQIDIDDRSPLMPAVSVENQLAKGYSL